MCSVSAERCQPESHHSSWCSVALVSPSLFSEGAANKGGVCVCVCVCQCVRWGASRGHAVTGRAGPDPWVLLLQGGKVTFSLLYSGTERMWLPRIAASLALYETDTMNQCFITDSWHDCYLTHQLLLIVLLLFHCGDAILKCIICCIHLHYLET